MDASPGCSMTREPTKRNKKEHVISNSQERRNTTHPPPPPRQKDTLVHHSASPSIMSLRARLHGSRKKFERSKTCKDPPFVYSGPAEFARFRVNGLYRQKNSSDEKFVRTRVNWISETREHLKYFWTEFFKAGLK